MKKQRKLSVYEKNQLLKYNKTEANFLKKGAMPVEYFTGFVEFKGLDLILSPAVLIPRIETEELLDLITKSYLDDFKEQENFSYLEVGIGSGAISLSFLKFLEDRDFLQNDQKYFLTDISKEALKIAQKNLRKNLKKESLKKIEILESNLLEKIDNKKFNLLVANLPYIPRVQMEKLADSVKNFEPSLALDGGKTGFELIAKLLEELLSKKLLARNAKIFLELDQSHDRDFVEKNFPMITKNFKLKFIKDQFSRNRFLVIEEAQH